MADGTFRCKGCKARASATAGTTFDKTRTPLTVWFSAAWLFATQKDGVSAQSLQRAPMYSPAWLRLLARGCRHSCLANAQSRLTPLLVNVHHDTC